MQGHLKEFLDNLQKDPHMAGEVVHIEHIAPRPAQYAPEDLDLPPALAQALKEEGINRLFVHQARALNLARDGQDLVAATPTASGKTLIYALPVLERLLAHPQEKALFLFPLKALEQDQLAALNRLALAAGLGEVAAVYDGDTPPGRRRRLREKPPAIIISNPDMVHASICAYADAWGNFLKNLRFVVIDEVHTYRGVFGSHVVQVLRRLLRLAGRQGADPRFILSSATIANPLEHAQALTGRKFSPGQVVAENGAPAAGRHFALINPATAASTSAARLFTQAVRRGLSTICFTKSRLHTELIHAWVTRQNPDLRGKVAGYRAGFLPEERRKIEAGLAKGSLVGVITTSALEMGIDIGELDVCILVGYPGSQINTWQRGGRVGRSGRDSAIFMVAQPDALDQYFIKHPGYFFDRPVEAAVLDPDNANIVEKHLVCAAAEEPLDPKERFFDLKRHNNSIESLKQSGELLQEAQGERLFAARKRPQRFVDLRGSGDGFVIVDPKGRVVGSLDGVRVYKEGYPGAVYLHQTRSYMVRKLDLMQKKVLALPAKADYYTRARSEKETEIIEETGRRPAANFLIHQGRLRVTEQVTGYERRNLRGGGLLGVFPLDLPPLVFETHGLWMDIEQGVRSFIEQAGRHFMGAIHALEHAAISMFPLFALCDRGDIGGISIPLHPQTGKAAVFIYDGVPGGVGLAERGYEVIEALLERVEGLLADCPCEEGCPACVHSPKCGSGNKPLDKQGALLLTRALLGKEKLEALPEPVAFIEPLVKEEQCSPETPLDFCVFDLETQRLAGEVGGWGNAHLMRVSVGVLYDSKTREYKSYSEKEVPRLIQRLKEFDMVIGFNVKRFDYAVLGAYTPFDLHKLPTLDILQDIHRHLKFRLSLQSLAEATLGASKSADGLLAVEWWRQGKLEELAAYCQQDVAITRDLFCFGQKEGHLIYQRKDGAKLRIPMDWSWPTLRERFKG